MATTLQIPVGRGHALLANMPAVVDYVIGGWQYTASARYYSGRLLMFNTSYIVDGDPTLDNPTHDRWFDTTKFKVQDSFKPRTNPWYYDGLTGPSVFLTDMTLTKMFNVTRESHRSTRRGVQRI